MNAKLRHLFALAGIAIAAQVAAQVTFTRRTISGVGHFPHSAKLQTLHAMASTTVPPRSR